MRSRRLKRAVDLLGAGLLLVLLAPVLLALALAIRLTMGSPVLFRQLRPGRGEKPFGMIKFRSMSDARDGDGELLPDAARLTRLGRFLRATSLDELPELWNVVRGEMSLVGPRPLLMQYLPVYTERERRRHEVRPGITGLAQVSGRNALPWRERLELDARYVENWSLSLDMAILLRTVAQVLLRRGVHVVESAVLPDLDVERRCAFSGEQSW